MELGSRLVLGPVDAGVTLTFVKPAAAGESLVEWLAGYWKIRPQLAMAIPSSSVICSKVALEIALMELYCFDVRRLWCGASAGLAGLGAPLDCLECREETDTLRRMPPYFVHYQHQALAFEEDAQRVRFSRSIRVSIGGVHIRTSGQSLRQLSTRIPWKTRTRFARSSRMRVLVLIVYGNMEAFD